MREIKSGLYRHFKGSVYLVHGVAEHTETHELFVAYETFTDKEGKSVGRKMYVRPLEMFASKVDAEKYPDANQEYRFEFIG